MDRKKMLESAKKFDINIDFDVDKAGVYDKNSGSFFTFEELLRDILPSEELINMNLINKNNKILMESYKRKYSNHKNTEYSLDSNQNKYNIVTKKYKWMA